MAAEQIPLPLSWTADSHLVRADGGKLKRWGSVELACAMLDDCDRHDIYDLIAIGAIKGYKRKPHRPNSHYRIDLLTVWEHKQRQMAVR